MNPKCDAHSGIQNQVTTNKEDIQTLYNLVDKIRNRPPVWMSLAFAAALGVIGWLAKGVM